MNIISKIIAGTALLVALPSAAHAQGLIERTTSSGEDRAGESGRDAGNATLQAQNIEVGAAKSEAAANEVARMRYELDPNSAATSWAFVQRQQVTSDLDRAMSLSTRYVGALSLWENLDQLCKRRRDGSVKKEKTPGACTQEAAARAYLMRLTAQLPPSE